jgi:alpha-galactosidase
MARKGLQQDAIPAGAYEPVWCAWGYDRNFQIKSIIDTLPKAKALGLAWAGLDDGWQTSEGDWYLDRKKFPRGDADMTAFAAAAKAAGLKPKLWIAPLAVDPGTDLLHDHVDMLLLDKDGAVQDVTWWNAFTLCPAYQPTIDNATALVRKILGEWGYDGLKLDGQHLNGVAPCFNPAHHHARPEDSVEKLQDFWKAIYLAARAIKPDVVVEICPCGTSQSFFNMAYQNQAVGSDPLSSQQVRQKGKTLKALMGPQAPYCGDHVELSDGGNDFASSVGIGAVVATKFALPGIPIPEPALALTPEKELVWAKWIRLYRQKMLSTGTYRGELYDIGFDKPEAHAVEKDGVMHYAFYADRWAGPIDLRGLQPGTYTITDYVSGQSHGEVSGANHRVDVRFEKYLLIEARRKRS